MAHKDQRKQKSDNLIERVDMLNIFEAKLFRIGNLTDSNGSRKSAKNLITSLKESMC